MSAFNFHQMWSKVYDCCELKEVQGGRLIVPVTVLRVVLQLFSQYWLQYV